MEIIKIKKKDILLLRLYIIFMSGVVMLYLNMCHNKKFLKILNVDYGMAQLMKNIAFLIIGLLIVFYCYLHAYFWKQIFYQLGVVFAFGGNKERVIKAIIKQRIKEMSICMMIGISLGYLCYILLLLSLEQNNYVGIVTEPVLLLLVIYGLGIFIQYKLVISKRIMDFIISNEKRFKELSLSVIVSRVLGVLCLAMGFAGTIYLKDSGVVITSLWRFVPILIEAVGIYLVVKYWVLFLLKERKVNERNILLVEYIRREFIPLSFVVSSVAIAAFLSIFVITIVLCSNTTISKQALEYDKPFDVVFDFAGNEDLLSEYLSDAKDKSVEIYSIKYLEGNLRWSTEKFDLPIMIIKQSDYAKLSKEELKVSAGNAMMLSQVDKSSVLIMTESDGKEWSFMPLGEIEFECGEIQKINLTDEIWDIAFNLKDQNTRTLILNEKDYNNLILKNSNEMTKFMIRYNESAEAKKIIHSMLENVTVGNLIVRESGINYQYAQRKIMVIFTFLTALVMLACLIIFQMLRLISEKEKWKQSKKILGMLGVGKIKLCKQIEGRMNIQTLYPALCGGTLGLIFSQVYIRQFYSSIFISALLIFLLTLLLEFIWGKYAVFYLDKN